MVSSTYTTADAARFRELDGLRGIAALAVVASHFFGGYDAKYTDEWHMPVSIEWGTFGVHLFFLISGFVILMTARRAAAPSDFVISRLSRLYPAYWIAVTLAIVVSIVFRVPQTQIPWLDRIMNYTMLQRFLMMENQAEVYWTLAIELQFYVLILVLLLITRSRLSNRVVLVVSLGWTAFSVVGSILMRPFTLGVAPQLVTTPVKLLQNVLVVEWGPYFAAGMLCFLARSDTRYRPWAAAVLIIAPLVSGITNGFSHTLLAGIVALLFAAVVFRDRTGPLLVRPLQFFGRISYSLYICHAVLAYAMIHLLVPVMGRIGAMLVAFVIVVAVSWGVHEVGEVRWTRAMKRGLQTLRNRFRDRIARSSHHGEVSAA